MMKTKTKQKKKKKRFGPSVKLRYDAYNAYKKNQKRTIIFL